MAESKIIREDDIAARIREQANRLVTDNGVSPAQRFKKGNSNIKFGAVDGIAKINMGERVSNQIILESNPNLTRAIEILAGLIVCPNGGSNITLNYSADVDGADEKYNRAATEVCKILDSFFTNDYKLQTKLYQMVYETLADAGSYVTAFIPDSNIDSMLDNEVGLEGDVKTLTDALSQASLYSLDKKSIGKTKVSKDFRLLRLREMRENLQLARDVVSVGAESDRSSKEAGINAAAILKRRRIYKKSPVMRMNRTLGMEERRPAMTMHLASEAVAPMIFRGNPEEPFGYLVALDNDGYPICTNEEIDFDKDLRAMANKDTNENQLIAKIANNFTTERKAYDGIDSLFRDFRDYLENDVYNSLIDGTYAEEYKLDDDALLAKIAFHRLLRNQKTHILYLPVNLVNYFAFDYDNLGIGRSLVSRTKALSNIYTVLFYANFMGSLSNAIPRKMVTVDFDKDDFDKNKRMEEVVNQLIMTQVGSFDFNYRGPADLMSNLTKYGLEFKFNNVEDGDLPAMDIDITDKKRDIRPIDSTFMDQVAKLIGMRVGFSPSLIDQSYQPKFSSEVVRDNDLTARQISKYVEMTAELLSDYVVKYIINDPSLTNDCLEVIKGGDNAQELLQEILANLVVSTPTTEINGLDENLDAVQDIINAVGSIVDSLYPSSYVNGLENASADEMAYFQDTLKGYLLEDYMRKNSSFKAMVDEVIDMDKLESLFKDAEERKVGMMKIFANYNMGVQRADKLLDKKLADLNSKLGNPPEEETTTTPDEPASDDGQLDMTPPDETEPEEEETTDEVTEPEGTDPEPDTDKSTEEPEPTTTPSKDTDGDDDEIDIKVPEI